jgi:CshA-type fibril repeat protein
MTERPAALASSRRRRIALAVASALLAPVTVLTATSFTPVAAALAPVPGGPVVLDGNDPNDHGADIAAYIRNVYTNLDANVAPGYSHNGKVAVVGTCKAMLDGMSTGQAFEQFTGAAAVADLFENIGANNYEHVHICSDEDSTLDAATQSELNNWGAAIAHHVNRGGGLFATGHRYVWLSGLFPTIVVTAGGTPSSYVTADGEAFFTSLRTNDQVNAINHYTFTGNDTTPLKPLLTEFQFGAGRRVAIGGRVVRFPQIVIEGPAFAEVGVPETYVMTAATADGTLLSNNTFTYTITGPTGAAVTNATGTTDANGQFRFTFAANARGATKIAVQMTLGSGDTAGSFTRTAWGDLPSEPINLAAEEVSGQPSHTKLTWNAPADPGAATVTDYVVQHSKDGTAWTTVADGTSTSTTHTVTGLDASATYRFRVAAVTSEGRGSWSNIVYNKPYATQTLTFDQPAGQALSAGSVALTAAATPSGLPVTFTSSTPAVCTVAGAVATLVAPGACSITANQAGDAIYLPATPVTRGFQVTAPAVTPTPPAAPTPEKLSSTGEGTAPQQKTADVPPGGSVTLLDASGSPVTTIAVPGEGTYVLDPATGVITFTALKGFVGTGKGVAYRVTTKDGASATSTYTPHVTLPSLQVGTGELATSNPAKGTVPVTCGVDGTLIAGCTVTIWKTVDGKNIRVGTGTVTIPAGGDADQAKVTVKLTKKGRELAVMPGGRMVRVVADITQADGTTTQVRARTRLAAKRSLLPRPVFFAVSKSEIRPKDADYLRRLRARMIEVGVTSVTCIGYTDWNGSGRSNDTLGMNRAKAVCKRLTKGTDIEKTMLTRGERRPHASNANKRGRQLNRRTSITLLY